MATGTKYELAHMGDCAPERQGNLQADTAAGEPLFACEQQVANQLCCGAMSAAELVHNFSTPITGTDQGLVTKTRHNFAWAVANIDKILTDMLAQGWIRETGAR